MYFERGDLTKNLAFGSAMPQEHLNRPSYELGVKQLSDAKAEQNPIRNPLKSQDFTAKATELYNTAKAQEVEFKEFLENLKSANNSLELGQILKSESSIESKIARKQED